MTSGRPRVLLLGLAAALAASVLTLTGAVAAERPDPAAVARQRLTEDTSGTVRILADDAGRVGFVGTGARADVNNPDVQHGASVAAAARAHLDRYGALLGAAGDTTYVRRSTAHTASGLDVVGYTQQVDGVPVIGGDVVVSMAADRGLRSIQSTVSAVRSVGAATVAEEDAAAAALHVVRRDTRSTHLQVASAGRWLLDPQVVDVSLPSGARSAWRFEVGDGAGVRQLVLVDDHTGGVLLRSDLVEQADPDRVVCDRANARGSETSCTSGFARTESDGATGNPDVDSAFDLSGAVADFYQQVAGVSLTQLLGIDVGGVKKLASTVRFCTDTQTDGVNYDDPCPYDNAFWNGQQMFYGDGWAGADDVVGHEMTHGFVDQYSKLFYWGQSGAINESMADVIGEIVDHRHPSAGDSAGDWRLGEDSPLGTLRSLSDPTQSFLGQPGQPDRTTSTLYDADASYADNGGVHTNSGVGNKTAYLISQGGTFDGQTITGIDGADPSLTKTAKLYVDVIERLSSGAGWRDLAAQLDQSCQDLRARGGSGFTAADCTAVHQAGVATQLTTTPTNAAQPMDADTTCPSGTLERVLFDSETGDPTSKFVPEAGWVRTSTAGDSNASSGSGSWFAADPTTAQTHSLRADAVTVPEGQKTYLAFEGWQLLDYDAGHYYDGGTVELAVDFVGLVSAEGLPWINGPALGLAAPNSGTPAFAGDSHGWTRSRVDLSSYAGSTVRPQFTLRSDSSVGFIGWYLDDISVYTCDKIPPPPAHARAFGDFSGITVTWDPPASNAADVDHYSVDLAGLPSVDVPTSVNSIRLTNLQPCTRTCVVYVQSVSKYGRVAAAVLTVWHPVVRIHARRSGARLTFTGDLWPSSHGRGRPVSIQRHTRAGWVTVKTVTTGARSTYKARIRHRKHASYRAIFGGGQDLFGAVSVRRRW